MDESRLLFRGAVHIGDVAWRVVVFLSGFIGVTSVRAIHVLRDLSAELGFSGCGRDLPGRLSVGLGRADRPSGCVSEHTCQSSLWNGQMLSLRRLEVLEGHQTRAPRMGTTTMTRKLRRVPGPSNYHYLTGTLGQDLE